MWTVEQVAHMLEHGITVEMANESIDDPAAIEADPDPKSVTGLGVRRVGHSPTRGRVLTVIVIRRDGLMYGASGWPASGIDYRSYADRTEGS